MGKQSKAFLEKEGDAWYARNYMKLEGVKEEPIGKLMRDHRLPLEEAGILEYGCANGWRLQNICEKFGCKGFGVDPSKTAIENGKLRYKDLVLIQGDATDPGPAKGVMAVVIYGFCLYLADREDVFEIVNRGHQAVAEGGFIVIHDFDPEHPHKIRYHHAEDQMLFSYKQDYSKLWLAHPAYSLIEKRTLGDGTALWLLRKNTVDAYPVKKLEDVQ